MVLCAVHPCDFVFWGPLHWIYPASAVSTPGDTHVSVAWLLVPTRFCCGLCRPGPNVWWCTRAHQRGKAPGTAPQSNRPRIVCLGCNAKVKRGRGGGVPWNKLGFEFGPGGWAAVIGSTTAVVGGGVLRPLEESRQGPRPAAGLGLGELPKHSTGQHLHCTTTALPVPPLDTGPPPVDSHGPPLYDHRGPHDDGGRGSGAGSGSQLRGRWAWAHAHITEPPEEGWYAARFRHAVSRDQPCARMSSHSRCFFHARGRPSVPHSAMGTSHHALWPPANVMRHPRLWPAHQHQSFTGSSA